MKPAMKPDCQREDLRAISFIISMASVAGDQAVALLLDQLELHLSAGAEWALTPGAV